MEESSPEAVVVEEEQSKEDKSDTTLEILMKQLPPDSDFVLEIFSHLPPTTLFRFKCVSKSLSNLTTQLLFASKYSRSLRANTTYPFTGFFFRNKLKYPSMIQYPHCHPHTDLFDYIDIPSFLSIKVKDYSLPDPLLDFLQQEGNDDVVELTDSCNGLLLCSNTTWTHLNQTGFVCNPLTKERVLLPLPRLHSIRSHFSLMADSTTGGYLEYKVVCVFRPKQGDPCSKLSIFSSESGEWKEFSKRLPVLVHQSMMGSKVFINGRLFWDCLEGHILICYLNVKKWQRWDDLIEAPRAPLGRCLWNLKDKLLGCYCHGFSNEFPVWSLWVNDKNKLELEWKAESCDKFKMLTEDISTQYTENWLTLNKATNKPRIRFRILGCIGECQGMFLWIPDAIYSYKFRERELKFFYGYRVSKFKSPSVALPYFHSLAPIQIGEIAQEKQGREKQEVETNINGSNATKGYMELISLYENWANNVSSKGK